MKDAQFVIIPNSLRDFYLATLSGHFLLASCMNA